jgi:PadR family transcriptional regulator PadR
MRMTRHTRAALAVMLRHPGAEHYGLELAREARLFTGTIYPILARLENNGWLDGGWEPIDPRQEGRPRRRYYKLTALGLERARALKLSSQDLKASPGYGPAGLPSPLGQKPLAM